MPIESFLTDATRRYAGKTALVSQGERLDYATLERLSDRLAAHWQAKGLTRGDRVVLLLDNSWQAAMALFACFKAGAIAVPITPLTKAERLATILGDCTPTILVTQARLAGLVETVGPVPLGTLVVDKPSAKLPAADLLDPILQQDASPLPHSGIDSDLALLLYTSGSSGEPKAVMISHGNADAASASVLAYLDARDDDVILNTLPMSHGYGLYQLIMSVRSGATLVLERSFAFPQSIFATIAAEGVTALPLVPSTVATILAQDNLAPGAFPTLRYITSAAANLPVPHIERLKALMPDIRIYVMYGQTECKRATYLPPERLLDKIGSVGIAIPNTEVFLVDPDGQRLPLGAEGELVVRGPHVMQGYWQAPDKTARALRSGDHPWDKLLFTGDIFRTDSDGFLYFIGRKDEIIKSRGEKVAPAAVEAVLLAFPGISEALVFGVPDEVYGEAILAIVVCAQELDEREIVKYCASRLEDYMIPKTILFRNDLPRTPSGKASRRLAAAMLE